MGLPGRDSQVDAIPLPWQVDVGHYQFQGKRSSDALV